MLFDPKKIIAGAFAGFVSAFGVDIHSWSLAPKGSPFDWGTAVKRWVGGAVAGAMVAIGIGQAA